MKKIKSFFLKPGVSIAVWIILSMLSLVIIIGFPVLLYKNWQFIQEFVIRERLAIAGLVGLVIVVAQLLMPRGNARFTGYTNYQA